MGQTYEYMKISEYPPSNNHSTCFEMAVKKQKNRIETSVVFFGPSASLPPPPLDPHMSEYQSERVILN